MKNVLDKIISMRMVPGKGVALLLGDEEHFLAHSTGSGPKSTIKDIKTVDSLSLKGISRKASRMSVCFSPRNIYSDVGDFSSVSCEATTAHIRSTIDKIGLFKDDYLVAFTKIQDVDSVKGKYSYLAVPSYEMNKSELLDEEEAIVDMFCPIEASLASIVGAVDASMVVIVYSDAGFIRIIGAKAGIIYYLISINSAESFDALADTVSGIREMTSMLQSSSREKVNKIYLIGQGDVGTTELEKHDIKAEPFVVDQDVQADPRSIVLMGTVSTPRYDFTPERFQRTKRIVAYAKISFAASILMLLIAAVLFTLALSNAATARSYEKKANAALFRSSQELRVVEKDYALLSKNLDLTKINSIMETYKNFQAEPKLHMIAGDITKKIPEKVFITKIEVKRGSIQGGAVPGQAATSPGTETRTIQAVPFGLVIEGVINSPYPKSKEIFAGLIMAMEDGYHVSKASFSQKEQTAEFTLNCEIKP